MSKKSTTSNDQDTRRLLGQLVPLQESSAKFDKAREEAVHGLTKARSSNAGAVKTSKDKGKVQKALVSETTAPPDLDLEYRPHFRSKFHRSYFSHPGRLKSVGYIEFELLQLN
jgi:hypothetical protein